MDQGDVNAFEAGVAGLLGKLWGNATAAGKADTAECQEMWSAATSHGWFDLEGVVDAVLALQGQLGRVACPLPVVDGFVASRLAPRLQGVIASGEVRLAVVPSAHGDEARHVEFADALTHVLVLDAVGEEVSLRPVLTRSATPGLARPEWSTVTLGDAEESFAARREEVDEGLVLVRLGLAARSLAAACRMHELAMEHSKNRVQFGRQIGSFQAVQQRTASCHIDVTAAELLIDRATEACLVRSANWTMSAELATDFIVDAARRVQIGAHHTLAAVGYFEEHEGPWLFRRVHADVARIPAFEPSSGTTVDQILDGDDVLPQFTLDDVGEAFRVEVRAAIDALRGPIGRDDFDEARAIADFASRGWFGLGWPEEYGGRNATLTEQVVLHDEIAYHRLPAKWTLSSVMLLGNSILLHGTEDQKQRFFPLIRAGELKYCLGYSEPEVGSDLASVATRAVRSGDDWVINGQKIWTTNAHTAKYIWLATRTDPEAKPRHAGITMFLVPMDTPGITVQQMTSLSGEISCAVFLDDVRVPDSARVGDVDGGWKVITDALVGERISMGGIATQLHRQLDDVLVTLRTDPDGLVGPRGSAGRASLRGMVASLQAARALVASAIGAGGDTRANPLAGPMAGVFGGELAETWSESWLDILGPDALLAGPEPDVPGSGDIERLLRTSIMYVVGGGTNDIQRGLIARALGLPK